MLPVFGLSITTNGQLIGLLELLNGIHKTFAAVIEDAWLFLVEAPFRSDTHHLVDVVKCFSMMAKRRKQQKQHQLGLASRAFLERFRHAVLKWVAARTDSYIVHTYALSHNTDKSAPSLTSHGGRRYVSINADTIWNTMVGAKHAGASLRQAIKLKSEDGTLGCSWTCGDIWINKYQQMYHDRAKACFSDQTHINIVADAGTHDCKEVFVGVAYSWARDLAAYPPMQYLLPGKDITT